nr:hypothetical protein CFP56_70678 [Quercus suber]
MVGYSLHPDVFSDLLFVVGVMQTGLKLISSDYLPRRVSHLESGIYVERLGGWPMQWTSDSKLREDEQTPGLLLPVEATIVRVVHQTRSLCVAARTTRICRRHGLLEIYDKLCRPCCMNYVPIRMSYGDFALRILHRLFFYGKIGSARVCRRNQPSVGGGEIDIELP